MTSQDNKKNAVLVKSVKDRLVDAAEELFCERGFKGTSIRDIAASAGCNIASVNYYFGGKQRFFTYYRPGELATLLTTAGFTIAEMLAEAVWLNVFAQA